MEVKDIGRLIDSIQERTFLWDEKNNHYRDRKSRDIAWMEIGDEMFDNWSQLSETQKAEQAKLMKDKWKHVKDSFWRSVRQGYENIYADSLCFLLDNYKAKKNGIVKNKAQNDDYKSSKNLSSNSFSNTNGLNNAQSSIPQETSDCSSSDSIQNTNELRNVQPSLSQGTSDCSSDSVQNTGRLRSAQPILSQEMLKKAELSPKQDKDNDKMFLDSLLRDYRELEEDEKLDFRIMCLQHIQAAKKKKEKLTKSHFFC